MNIMSHIYDLAESMRKDVNEKYYLTAYHLINDSLSTDKVIYGSDYILYAVYGYEGIDIVIQRKCAWFDEPVRFFTVSNIYDFIKFVTAIWGLRQKDRYVKGWEHE